MKQPPRALPLLPLPLVLAVACGGQTQAPTRRTAPPPPAPQASAPPAPPKSVTAGRVAVVEPPSRIACRFEHMGPLPGTWKLRLNPSSGAPPYASIAAAKRASIAFPVGPFASAFVKIGVGPATVEGWIDAADAPLYPQKAEVLGGGVIPMGESAVTVLEGAVDSVHFRASLNEHAKLSAIESTLPCAYFGTTPGGFDATSALPAGQRSRVAVRVGPRPLYKEATGEATLGTLVGDTAAPYAFSIGASASRAVVAWPVGPSLVFGYMERKDVALATETKTDVAAGPKPAIKAPPHRETGVATFREIRCTADLPLVAEVDGNKREIGAISNGELFQVGPDLNGFSLVAFPSSDLLTSDAGKLLVATTNLASCK